MKPIISLIAAIDEKRGIGKSGTIPWYIPGEQKRFKEITTPHPIIMGRKTHQSIGRALPNRLNIVITRDQSYTAEGCVVVHSLEDALKKAKEVEKSEIFVIGGGEIYTASMPYADRLYLTMVKGDYGANAFFPDYSGFKTVVHQETVHVDDLSYDFLIIER